ncbi:MAG: APC family permease [Chitinophagaceae bacterium]
MSSSTSLSRSLSLTQAAAINMIDMVGIGPFIVLSTIVSIMGGAWSIAAWLLGALLAYADGCIWAELGAKWPQAGGSYVFLQKIFPGKGGRMMSFLFVWQTMIQAPLVVASASIGFALYFQYIVDLHGIGHALFGSFDFDFGSLGHFRDADLGPKMLSGTLVILMVILLYRNIQSIGRISVALWCVTGGTLLWLIVSGIPHFNVSQAFPHSLPNNSFRFLFSAALGQASLKAVYSYLGYYNVCHIGAEIKEPERNIPRAIFISITGIAILYLLMQTMVLGNLDWRLVAKSDFVVSLYFEKIYNHNVAVVATGLVLCIALASLFSVLLGYSRVPYAAAVDGLFFPVFAKLHKRHRIPHISLLTLGALGFVFSLLFKMKEVITAIIVMRIVVQFLAQGVGVIAWHRRDKNPESRPWRMPLFPLPALLSMLIWLFIFFSSQWQFIAGASGIILLGMFVYSFVPNKAAASS